MEVKGICKLAVVVGVNNTHVDVHHVVEDGDRNPDTDVDVDVDVAAAVAAGDIPLKHFTKNPMNCNMHSK